MAHSLANPWRRFLIPTLGLWAGCCLIAMMFLDGGYFGAFYIIASGLFWIAVAVRAYLRPDPSNAEILIYRLGPLILWLVGFGVRFTVFQNL